MRQFVADASHELRTPITATAAYAELFERGAKDRPDDLERAMTGIRSETSRMADLVEDLLLLAQLDEQRPITRTPVDLAAVAFESVDAATAVAPDRPVRLRVDDVAVVIGDPSRLRQVLDNLLANVRTHTPPATPCSLTVRREGDDAVVIVADEGPGMNSGDAARRLRSLPSCRHVPNPRVGRIRSRSVDRRRDSRRARRLGRDVVGARRRHHGHHSHPHRRGHIVNDVVWYLSRATGIVAAVLAVAALAGGFLFSARETGTRRRPAWWLDLHNWLGGLTLIFTIAHVVIAYLDSDTGLSLASLFVPGVASSQRLAVAWGVIATYLFATTVLSSWPRKRFARRTWRIVHLGSVLGVALALVHAYQMGTDGTERAFRIGMLLLVAIGTYTLFIRLVGVLVQRRDAARAD